MKIKFLKDQKWVIDHRTVSFEENEVKEIKDKGISEDMIRLGYGLEYTEESQIDKEIREENEQIAKEEEQAKKANKKKEK